MSGHRTRRGSRHNMDRHEFLASGARLYALRGQQLPHARLTESDIAKIRRLHAQKKRLVERLNRRYSAAGLAQPTASASAPSSEPSCKKPGRM